MTVPVPGFANEIKQLYCDKELTLKQVAEHLQNNHGIAVRYDCLKRSKAVMYNCRQQIIIGANTS